MIFRQFRFEKLGQASYLVGCGRSKEALVVDPIADLGVDHYVIEAADRGLAVTHVLGRIFMLISFRAPGSLRRPWVPSTACSTPPQ